MQNFDPVQDTADLHWAKWTAPKTPTTVVLREALAETLEQLRETGGVHLARARRTLIPLLARWGTKAAAFTWRLISRAMRILVPLLLRGVTRVAALVARLDDRARQSSAMREPEAAVIL